MSILDIMTSNIWQFVGVVFAALAILATFVVYRLQSQKKDLSVGKISARRLLSVSEEIKNRIIITYDGLPISDVWLIFIGVKNSGNKPIIATDFTRPLTIKFHHHAKILSFEIIKQNPSNLGILSSPETREIKIEPLLINPGDYFIAKALISSKDALVEFDTRIVDVPELSTINTGYRFGPTHKRKMRDNIITLFAISLCGAAWHFAIGKLPLDFVYSLLVFASMLAAVTIFQWIRGKIKNHEQRYIDDSV